MAYLYSEEWQLPDAVYSPFLSRDLDSEVESVCQFFEDYPNESHTVVRNVLNRDGLTILEDMDIPVNGKYPTEKLLHHPVGSVLVSIMGGIALRNKEYDLKPERVSARIKNESGENLVLPSHRDLLDWHALIYNWDVEGDLDYVVNGFRFPVENNAILVLNGAANWQEVTSAFYEKVPDRIWRFGGTTAVHGVVGNGPTSRNRLLVYADGIDTNFTQITEDEYGPVPEVADNILFMGLRPSYGFYV